MKNITAKLKQTYGRIVYQQLPIASLLQPRFAQDGTLRDHASVNISKICIAGVMCDFVSLEHHSTLTFRTRLAPSSSFSVWLGALRHHSEAEFIVTAQCNDHYQTLAQISLTEGSGARWTHIKLPLHQFAGQEITLVLSGKATSCKDSAILGWADPRILRKRAIGEYYAQARGRLVQGGITALVRSTRAVVKAQPDPLALFAEYPRWLQTHSLTEQQIAEAKRIAAAFTYKPLISIITPTFNTEPEILRACIRSVQAQVYPNWELCICDDGSSSDETKKVIADCGKLDTRINMRFLPENRGVAHASNVALEMSAGEFIGLLDHDDELSPDTLFENVRLLQSNPDADVIYSDEDKLDADGQQCEPFFKPDWSPELLRSCMYTCHFSLYRRELIRKVGDFRPGFEGAQDYDLMLRVSEHTRQIFHIPKILYHWRKSQASTAGASTAKTCSTGAGLRALKEHVSRIGLEAEVTMTDCPNHYHVKPLIRGNPLVSIVIPHKDKSALLDKCIRSINSRTKYRNYEVIIVDNGSSSREALEYLATSPHRVISFTGPFNFSAINNFAARRCKGEYLLLLNDDTEVISAEWLSSMLAYAQMPEVGAVGAKLYYPHDAIQHAGVILGMRGIAGHWLYGFPRNSRGYFNSLYTVRDFSAVTAACLLLRREVFESVGGFDEELAVSYNDVDLCLRIRQAGYRIVWVPYAELYHCEFGTRSQVLDPKEVEYIKNKWGPLLKNDPFYNPNLTLDSGALALRF